MATVVIINDGIVKFSPDRPEWGHSESGWMRLYRNEKLKKCPAMFEICENQTKKFMEKGIVPMNFDW